MLDSTQTFACPGCSRELKISEVLEHCDASWPEHHLLYFKCPGCRMKRHLKVHDDQVSVGYLDGFPGPRFVTSRKIIQPGLTVRTDRDSIELSLDEQVWVIPAKE